MQITCTDCKGRAIINSRKHLDDKVSQLYCSCKDPLCGHTFVMDLSFSHTLSPSGQHSREFFLNLIRQLPEDERQEILAAV